VTANSILEAVHQTIAENGPGGVLPSY
jgi:hypothetical protein